MTSLPRGGFTPTLYRHRPEWCWATRRRGGNLSDEPLVPPDASALTAVWLTEALRPTHPEAGTVTAVRVEPLGIGYGLVGALRRLHLSWEHPAAGGPNTLVAKVTADGSRSRAVADAMGLYRNEVRFNQYLGPATPLAVPCHHAGFDEATGAFVLLLEDMGTAGTYDQIEGCPPERAEPVVEALADHHAASWDEAGLGGHTWLRRMDDPSLVAPFAAAFAAGWPGIRERAGDRLPPGVRDLGDRFLDLLPALLTELTAPPRTLVHGDFRLDNMFFGPGDRVTLCDWQLTDRSRGARDLAYFLTQSLTPDDRAAHEQALIDCYVDRLAGHGVDYGRDQVWHDYRVATVFALMYPVVAGTGLDLGERAARLTDLILDRCAAALVDLGCAR
jgi:aminoglycoside/choline kinase family phosphotransferase